MHHTDLTDTVLDGATFAGNDISTVIWAGVTAINTSFRGCVARGARVGPASGTVDWSGADLTDADFASSDLSGVNLSGAQLGGCSLVGARLVQTTLTRAVLGGVAGHAATDLSYAYLENVSFGMANCFGVSFASATVYGALTNLTASTTLEQADFTNSYLEGINLSGATLRGSKFDNACMIGVNLTNADLAPTSQLSTPTSLTGACLHGTRFAHAELEAVDLTNATMSFEQGHVPVRYCDASGGPPPKMSGYAPVNFQPTTGLDATTLRDTTVCPNGARFATNKRLGHDLRTMLSATDPAKRWSAIGCAPSGGEPA